MKPFVWEDFEPKGLFHWFTEICAIPRGSYHEEKAADFLVSFAEKRGLFCYRDALHNVLIRLPATPGREGEPGILLQGHTDMVCEKNAGVDHDFSTDGITVYQDGDWLRADGTTLGGDDGIAVAVMLSVLDGDLESHPQVECLFTSAEEVGLDGASGFDFSKIQARKLINLDSEGLYQVVAGCAGGVQTSVTWEAKTAPVSGTALRIELSGLCGGHSGANIQDGRANANVLLGRLLLGVGKEAPFRLAAIHGGSKENAIPRESGALILTEDAAKAGKAVSAMAEAIRSELSEEDHAFAVDVTEEKAPAEAFSAEDTRRIIGFVGSVPNGVLEMSRHIPGLVEFSRNLGVIRQEGNRVSCVFYARSALDTQLDCSENQLSAMAECFGASCEHTSRYSGWAYEPDSPLRERYLQIAEGILGKKPTVEVIHAGLECGLIRAAIPDMDIISVGPELRDIHSPGEKMSISSCEKLWKILGALLGNE